MAILDQKCMEKVTESQRTPGSEYVDQNMTPAHFILLRLYLLYGFFVCKSLKKSHRFLTDCLYFKFTEGEATEYISRNVALKKLQLNLKQFRTLCILKGIYPREPKERKRAQGGKGGIKTLYAKKDIQFLLHEPNIWKLWEGQVRVSDMFLFQFALV